MSNKKYVTTIDYKGMGYYDIAEVMTKCGHKMNHSTVRNIVLRSFSKIVKNISKEYGKKYSDEQIKKTPLNRLGQCEDISKTAYALYKDLLYITGQNVVVDGGRTLN